jgi:hypothetical protein
MTNSFLFQLPAKLPGIPVQNVSPVINLGSIDFPNGLLNSTLPPINGITINYNADYPSQSTINITVLFLIKQPLAVKHVSNNLLFTVYQYFCLGNEGKPQLQFYIAYNQKSDPTDVYNYGQLSFSVTNASLEDIGLTIADIYSIQTFMWDVDPKTSRGTVTTVLHAI